ncbi:MAG: HAD-IC family P-type ATPase, partial [Gammaproteobacteria bacterium]
MNLKTSSAAATREYPLPTPPHTMPAGEIVAVLQSSPQGLGHAEAAARLQHYGANALPTAKPPGIIRVFLNQFASPLIYVLVAAALVSLAIREWSDAIFICAVLLLNAIIGTAQEYSAQRAATALQQLVSMRSRVLREGDAHECDAQDLVPGDIVLLESGERVPADMRLLASHNLEVDESLLTGESMAVFKRAEALPSLESPLGDRLNMAFAGTLVSRGRGRGIVTGTALRTELGHIASAVLGRPPTKAPLLVRMERFTQRIALLIGAVTLLMAGVALGRGMPLEEIFLLAVALAVSAIPEGLPVALTVALAIGMRRMARRHVIVRRLLSVEALGSCTYIATDKTGTLTVNQLSACRVVFPGQEPWEVTGCSLDPEGSILTPRGAPLPDEERLLGWLCQAAV